MLPAMTAWAETGQTKIEAVAKGPGVWRHPAFLPRRIETKGCRFYIRV